MWCVFLSFEDQTQSHVRRVVRTGNTETCPRARMDARCEFYLVWVRSRHRVPLALFSVVLSFIIVISVFHPFPPLPFLAVAQHYEEKKKSRLGAFSLCHFCPAGGAYLVKCEFVHAWCAIVIVCHSRWFDVFVVSVIMSLHPTGTLLSQTAENPSSLVFCGLATFHTRLGIQSVCLWTAFWCFSGAAQKKNRRAGELKPHR